MPTYITPLLLGILVGAAWGAWAYELLVTDTLRRRARYLERRLDAAEFRADVADARLQNLRYLEQVMRRPGALDLDDNERWSRKAPTHVRIVK